ncbi:MAG: acyltransferase [Oscillospiraceae bacterium]|nr:acyltransferase [Oscillospiraceae bacterium]
MEKRRIDWVDGLKGIACILMFCHHFALIFFPATFYGQWVSTRLYGIDTRLAQSPLGVFLNGNFLLAVFCMLSALVLSLQILRKPDPARLGAVVAKRYFRLMPPLFGVGLVVWAFLRYGLFTHAGVVEATGSPWADLYYQGTMSFRQFLEAALVKVWFYGDESLSTAFWMLSRLFYGSFLSILLSTVAWKYPKRAWILYVVVAALLFDQSELLLAFALGTLLAWMLVREIRLPKFASPVAVLLGLVLGGYPSGIGASNFYRFFRGLTFIDWHILGAFVMILGILSWEGAQKCLSWRLFTWLGKISYSVYLIHIPLLFSLSTGVFLWTEGKLGYLGSVAVSFGVSLVTLTALSWLYHRFVETGCGKLQEKLFARLEKE